MYVCVCICMYVCLCVYACVCVCVCVYIHIYIYEKEMTTGSSIRAWEIPWTEDPDRLQSIALKRSQTQLRDLTTANIYVCICIR